MILKLKNGDVIRVDDIDLAKRLMENDEIERILFLGDVLITFGDFKKKKDLIRSIIKNYLITTMF